MFPHWVSVSTPMRRQAWQPSCNFGGASSSAELFPRLRREVRKKRRGTVWGPHGWDPRPSRVGWGGIHPRLQCLVLLCPPCLLLHCHLLRLRGVLSAVSTFSFSGLQVVSSCSPGSQTVKTNILPWVQCFSGATFLIKDVASCLLPVPPLHKNMF